MQRIRAHSISYKVYERQYTSSSVYHTSNFRISRACYVAGLYGNCSHLKYE